MSYTDTFYERYTAYLEEEVVRRKHDFALMMLAGSEQFDKVADLGCGKHQEFWKQRLPKEYLGIDRNVDMEFEGRHQRFKLTMQGDYKNDLCSILATNQYEPTAFVSLFSAECGEPQESVYPFYEKVFNDNPSIEMGLVSGFYYALQKEINPIVEACGIRSYQTLGNVDDHHDRVFDEDRLIMHVPSDMFGNDVYEVWKLLRRRNG